MAVTFDTMKFVETLERANLTRAQASAIAAAVRDAQDAAEVASKGDLREMELRLRSEQVLHRWMLGLLIAGVGAIFAKLFF